MINCMGGRYIPLQTHKSLNPKTFTLFTCFFLFRTVMKIKRKKNSTSPTCRKVYKWSVNINKSNNKIFGEKVYETSIKVTRKEISKYIEILNFFNRETTQNT